MNKKEITNEDVEKMLEGTAKKLRLDKQEKLMISQKYGMK